MTRVWRDAGSSSIRIARSASRAARARSPRRPTTPVIALGTAHPAKFPDAVEQATGVRPRCPPHLADLMERPGDVSSSLPNDRRAVADFLRRDGEGAA